MLKNLAETFQSNQRLGNLLIKLLVSLMMACAAISIAQLGLRILPNWNGWNYLALFVWLVALESILTREKVRNLEQREKILYHLAEWIIFAILLKIMLYAVTGIDQLWSDLPLLQQNPLLFFAGPFGPTLVVLIIAWMMSSAIIDDVEVLQSDMMDFKWELGKLNNNRQDARKRIAEKIFLLGGFMVFITMLTRLDLKQLWGETPISRASIANVVVYFLLSLALLSQTQFALMRGRWFWDQTAIAPHIGRNWIKYSLIFLGAIAVVSFFLPTRYTYSLLDVLGAILYLIAQVVLAVVGLFSIACNWFFSLFGVNNSPVKPLPPLDLQKLDTFQQAAGAAIPWWELLKSILFWGIILAIIGLALFHFLRQNSRFMGAIRVIPGFGWLSRIMKSIWSWLVRANAQVSSAISAGIKRVLQSNARRLSVKLPRFLNFKQMTPRQQVVFYYLQLVERSKRSGLSRKPYQTPNQFSADLETMVPDVQEDVENLTETFIEARYTRHPIEKSHTTTAQTLCRRIVQSLRPAK